MKILEICCETVTSAVIAQENGANRVELCSNLAQGGLTPSGGQIRQAKALLDIPVFVLIRPRKADFLYSDREFEQMLIDIETARDLGADGIVSGALLADGSVDTTRTRKLVEAAGPLPFTFHRAFDMSRNPLESIDQLVDCGVERILTSGQRPTAVEGLDNIRAYVEYAASRLNILAGGGIRPFNIGQLLEVPGLREFHAAIRHRVASRMTFRGRAQMGLEGVEQEFEWMESDGRLIFEMSSQI